MGGDNDNKEIVGANAQTWEDEGGRAARAATCMEGGDAQSAWSARVPKRSLTRSPVVGSTVRGGSTVRTRPGVVARGATTAAARLSAAAAASSSCSTAVPSRERPRREEGRRGLSAGGVAFGKAAREADAGVVGADFGAETT